VSDSDIGGDLPPLDPELAAWLAADSTPAMPEEVWASLQARLAAEPPLSGPSDPRGLPEGVADLSEQRRKTRVRVLPLLAGAAGVALVGAVVIPTMRSADPVPVAEGPAGVLAVTSSAGPDPEPPVQSPPAPALGSPAAMPRTVLTSGTDYTTEALPEQVVTLLASTGMADGSAVADAMVASPAATVLPGVGLASSPEALADCLGRLGLPAESLPLVLDAATIDGRAGSVIVTVTEAAAEPPGEPLTLHAVAVGQDCTDDDVAAARHWDVPLAP